MHWLYALSAPAALSWAAWSVAGLILAVSSWVRRRELLRERWGRQQLSRLAQAGEAAVPVSLHPYVDPLRCIGSGSCIAACPEREVLEIVDGVARLVNPLACVGHGACAAACGMDAIRLVFGTKEHGVLLPKLTEHFETTAPGVFVVGELAGMGLIRNALKQGVQAGATVVRSARVASPDALDAIIVGAGPAGTGAALALHQAHKRFVVFERDEYGGTIAHYPRGKVVMTGDLDFPGYGRVNKRRMSKQELIALWFQLRQQMQLPIRAGVLVTGLSREPDGMWRVASAGGSARAAHVILALGRRGAPRKLEVPGEELPKVSYRLLEPEEHRGKHVLVVGGGNSAIETALCLADYGGCASVSISYRREHFARARAENLGNIERALSQRSVVGYLGTTVTQVETRSVRLRFADGRQVDIDNDALIVQAGGTDPSALLRSFGVELETKHAEA